MKHLSTILITVLVGFVTAYITVQSFAPNGTTTTAQKESVYDRVMRTGTIRCGYIVYNPSIRKDLATGEISGIMHDLMEEVGQKLKLKIEWVQEAGWGTFIDDLKADKYDMLCSVIWPNSKRARYLEFTRGVYKSQLSIWLRADDARFDSVIQFNNPSITFASLDGTATDFTVRNDFPKAQILAIPELASLGDMINNVVTQKADATLVEDFSAYDYIRTNGDTVKKIGAPVRVFPNVMGVKKGEHDFITMINTAIDEVLMTGFMDRAYQRYDVPKGIYLEY